MPVAAMFLALWLIVDPRTPDLAAQVYRVGLFHDVGFAVWDNNWYAGYYLPGYSLLFPPLASLLGMRVVASLSVIASAALFERLALSVYGPLARWAGAWFAVAAVGDLWLGRLTFALGVSFAMAAVLALVRGRSVSAGVLAALCASASPVAGALLSLAGVSYALARRSPRAALTLAAPATVLVFSQASLFPEGGFEPFSALSFGATVIVVLAFLWALPPSQHVLRVGGLVYLLACVLCLVIHSPMGGNVERYAVLLAGPLLLCALLAAPSATAGGDELAGRGGLAALRASARRRLRPAAVVALCVSALYVVWGPVRETVVVAGDESTRASYYTPVKRFLAGHASTPIRIEVPFTRSHWEAALLAPTVSLARGWETQLDTRFNRVLFKPGLTAAAYGRWLHDQAVSYVALPDVPLDPSSVQEGRLIRSGLPFLREVLASRHWRIYAVLSPTPIASGPGRLISLGHNYFALRANGPGSFLVREHFTRYWTVARGVGCVGPAGGGWTSVSVRAPGTIVVRARFSLGRALGPQSSCTGSHAAP
ncbi:MAG TPA: hypothetical protein VGX72_10930 [Solirubrobacteraceae bacterium]|nr:hypothetical protein [Solirubrobacteraceae bacterium]